MDYLIVKTLHILSATILVGTGFGSAFYLFWTNRSGSVALGHQGGLVADHAGGHLPAALRPVAGALRRFSAHRALDLADFCAVRLRRTVLVASLMAATAHGGNGGRSCCPRKIAAIALPPLRPLLGMAGLPCLLRDGGGVLSDGAEAAISGRPHHCRDVSTLFRCPGAKKAG